MWLPPGDPPITSAKEYLRVAGKGNRWRGGLPLRHRSTIFPDDYVQTFAASADVLVSMRRLANPQGNEAIDLLAVAMGASRIYHGHTHDSLPYNNAEVQIFGVGLRGITDLNGTKLVPGELDEARAHRALR